MSTVGGAFFLWNGFRGAGGEVRLGGGASSASSPTGLGLLRGRCGIEFVISLGFVELEPSKRGFGFAGIVVVALPAGVADDNLVVVATGSGRAVRRNKFVLLPVDCGTSNLLSTPCGRNFAFSCNRWVGVARDPPAFINRASFSSRRILVMKPLPVFALVREPPPNRSSPVCAVLEVPS
jgi:hypothetical protein